MPIYLATYRPLVGSSAGRKAIERYHDPPFVDASCRREPDLEHEYPSITALCRGGNFAPRLQRGDTVVYLTAKGDYLNYPVLHWRMVAILQVIERCETHEDAARWYEARDLSLPGNCMVDGNMPLSMDRTGGDCGSSKSGTAKTVGEWDDRYWDRARKSGIFLICTPTHRELVRPPILIQANVTEVFGDRGMPNTLTPREISEAQLGALKRVCYIRDQPA